MNKYLETLSNLKDANKPVENNTELEKVELTRITDLEANEYELRKGIDDLMQFATDAREAIAKGKRELNRLDAVQRVSKRLLEDVQKAAKDLGVDVPEAKALDRMIKAYEQQRKSLIKVLN